MTEARIAREALAVAVHDDPTDTEAHIVREATAIAHHFPEADTQMRTGRLANNTVISRPHGWS